jgi:predicted porin
MNRKVLVAAVAAAFVAPAAFAQSSVTIGGTINILYDTVKASGATNNGGTVNNDLKSADRVRDGFGSNIRFSVIEDLGGGNSAFVQVETAVIGNSDTRANSVGTGGGVTTAGTSTTIWGNRNTGIGIRSKTAGRFLIGVWDVHYHESYKYDGGWIPGNAAQSTLGLTGSFGASLPTGQGAIGGRFSNVLRWNSPVWNGFSINAAYARPTDGAPLNTGSGFSGKKERVWNFSPNYVNGGLVVNWSYIQDKDITTAAPATMWGLPLSAGLANLKITGNRIGGKYKFANGLGIGALYDESKLHVDAETAAFVAQPSSEIKRHVWALMGTYDMGNHHFQLTYADANDWSGNIGGTGVGAVVITNTNNTGTNTVGSATGAKLWSMGYQYNLSQRTNVSLSYSQIRNDALVRYDFFANVAGLAAGQYGADPKTFAVGLRHTW